MTAQTLCYVIPIACSALAEIIAYKPKAKSVSAGKATQKMSIPELLGEALPHIQGLLGSDITIDQVSFVRVASTDECKQFGLNKGYLFQVNSPKAQAGQLFGFGYN